MEQPHEHPEKDPLPPLRSDPLLLWETGLVLVLLALFIVLFLLPASRQPFRPHWFAGPILAIGLFGVLFLDRWRRRGRNRRIIRQLAEKERSGRSDHP